MKAMHGFPIKKYLKTEKNKKRIHLPMQETWIQSLGQEDPL